MKVFARKPQRQSLSIMPARSVNLSKSEFEVKPGAIRHSFAGWLHTVPTEPGKILSISRPVFRTAKLSVLDVMRVNHATIREGESHRIWPPSVVQKFRTAEVITDRKTQHYQLSDANLRKV